MYLDGDILTFQFDVNKVFGPSSSGKRIIIAPTEGNERLLSSEESRIGISISREEYPD